MEYVHIAIPRERGWKMIDELKDKKSVRILGIDYVIKYREANSRHDGNLGLADTAGQEIIINKDQPEQNTNLTIFHEACHIISDILYLNFDEHQVSGISTGIYDMLTNIKKDEINDQS